MPTRRHLFAALAAALAQNPHAHHSWPFERLNQPGRIDTPALHFQHAVTESHVPMLTPRHGMGAVVLGEEIFVAGGGPQMGGGVKSAINEAFSLG